MSSDSYVFKEYVRGDWLVVDDLEEVDYAYAEDLAGYEVRRKGRRLGRFDDWSSVEEFLEEEK